LLWQSNRAAFNNVFGQMLPQATIPSMSGPVLADTSNTSTWGSAGGVLGSWQAFDFGLRHANVLEARAGENIAAQAATLTRLQVAQATASAFLAMVAAQQTVTVAQANVDRWQTFDKAIHVLVCSMVPILSNGVLPKRWAKHDDPEHPGRTERARRWLRDLLHRLLPRKGVVLAVYGIVALLILGLAAPQLGRELFPSTPNGLFRLSFHAPAGTRVADTEQLLLQTLHEIQQEAGDGNVSSSLGCVGLQGASYPINTVFL
jgi:hypothetical protein